MSAISIPEYPGRPTSYTDSCLALTRGKRLKRAGDQSKPLKKPILTPPHMKRQARLGAPKLEKAGSQFAGGWKRNFPRPNCGGSYMPRANICDQSLNSTRLTTRSCIQPTKSFSLQTKNSNASVKSWRPPGKNCNCVMNNSNRRKKSCDCERD